MRSPILNQCAGRGYNSPMQQKKEKGFLDTIGSYVSEKVNQVGSAISSANEAGQRAYDNSRKGTYYLGDFGGGSTGRGIKRDYEKNPIEYVKGFVSDIVSDNNTKPKPKKLMKKLERLPKKK
jgi:hypothetical protein